MGFVQFRREVGKTAGGEYHSVSLDSVTVLHIDTLMRFCYVCICTDDVRGH